MHQPSGRPSKVGKMLTGEPIAALLIKSVYWRLSNFCKNRDICTIYYIISQHFDNDLKNKAYFEDHLTPVLSKLTNYLFLKALYYIRQVFHHK